MKPDLKTAFRDSDAATRPYVLINPLLAKHLPVTPSCSLEYFTLLGQQVAAVCKDERVLVIGFAETATAVGAAVAASIPNAVYVHTTREELPANLLVSKFAEEHSHDKKQALYLAETWKDLKQYDRIVFVEDEITTGKTILNFLRSIDWNGKVTVSALVFNGFDENVFSRYKADFACLQKTGYVCHIEVGSLPDPRAGVSMDAYDQTCQNIAARIAAEIDEKDIRNQNILVIGTEECMYPALIVGRELEKTANNVMTQSTTRSPLLPGNKDEYPLHSKISFASVYDPSRLTYLYNMGQYDTVIIVTDSRAPYFDELSRAVKNFGNQTVYCVRFRDET